MDTIWATEADRFDAIAAPLVEPLFTGARVEPCSSVVDVGCGTGSTTRTAVALVGPEGLVVGIDVDGALLEVARAQGGAEYVQADATTYRFEPTADAVISRSTVMLFADPAAGLANVRRALRPGRWLAATCWQDEERNGWSAIPKQALGIPIRPAEGPGAFALADPERLHAVAQAAGFVEVNVRSVEYDAFVGADVDDTIAFYERVAGFEAPPQVVEALAPYAGPDGVRVPAAAWLLTARNP